MGDLEDWVSKKVGDGRFGSKMGAGTERLGKICVARMGDWPK